MYIDLSCFNLHAEFETCLKWKYFYVYVVVFFGLSGRHLYIAPRKSSFCVC